MLCRVNHDSSLARASSCSPERRRHPHPIPLSQAVCGEEITQRLRFTRHLEGEGSCGHHESAPGSSETKNKERIARGGLGTHPPVKFPTGKLHPQNVLLGGLCTAKGEEKEHKDFYFIIFFPSRDSLARAPPHHLMQKDHKEKTHISERALHCFVKKKTNNENTVSV